MENLKVINQDSFISEKRLKEEDLKLIREMIEEMDFQKSNGLILSKEDQLTYQGLIEKESQLETEIVNYTKAFLEIAETAMEATKANTDIWERGKRVTIGKDNNLESSGLDKGFQVKKKYERMKRETRVLQIEMLFEKHKEVIKRKGKYQVNITFLTELFFSREFRQCNKTVKDVIKQQLTMFSWE